MVSSTGRPHGSSWSGVALGSAVLEAGAAELAEGDGVSAGLGEEMAAVAEHVRPLRCPRCQAVSIIRLWWAEQRSACDLARARRRDVGRPGALAALVAYLAM